MILFKKNSLKYSNHKKTGSIDEIKLSILLDLICVKENGEISKKWIKNKINYINKNIPDNLNLDYIYDILEIDKDLKNDISSYVDSSKNLINIKYFYEKDFNENNDLSLIEFLNEHKKIEDKYKRILGLNYSAFSKSLNNYLTLKKQR